MYICTFFEKALGHPAVNWLVISPAVDGLGRPPAVIGPPAWPPAVIGLGGLLGVTCPAWPPAVIGPSWRPAVIGGAWRPCVGGSVSLLFLQGSV